MKRVFTSPQDANAIVNGNRVIQFGSNCYLGLSTNQYVIESAISALKQYGTCSGGSRLITGTNDLILELERRLAQFVGCEESMIFSSGYMTNIGTISAVCDEGTTVFSDRLNHASIIDGIKLSKAKKIIYNHNDIDDLRAKLDESKVSDGLIVTDSIFSMDGDIANIPELVRLAKKYNVKLMIDEAHSFGIVGRTSLEYLKVNPNDIDIIMGTFSKSLSSEGGFIAGKKKMIDYIRKRSRAYIFSAAPEPAAIGAALGALTLMEQSDEFTKKIQLNIKFFLEQLNMYGVPCKNKISAIFPIVIGDEAILNSIESNLLSQGLFVPGVRPPAVASGNERLRLSIMTSHTFEQLQYAAEKISVEMEKFHII